MRRTADGLAPLMLVGALILLVILGVGAFKNPGYHGTSGAADPSGPDAVTATPTPAGRPKHQPPTKAERHPTKRHKTAKHPERAKPKAVADATPAPVSTPRPVVPSAPRPVVTAPPRPAATPAPPPPSKPKPQSPAPRTTIDDSG